MNDINKKMFFDNDEDEVTLITLTGENGIAFDAQIMASLEIEDYDKEYIAVLPAEGNEQLPEDQLIILVYSEDEEGNPLFSGITDEKELQDIGRAFLQYFESQE